MVEYHRPTGHGRRVSHDSSQVTRSEQMNPVWVKSSLSFSNGNCVEVAELPGGSVGIRHSQDPEGPVLTFTRGEWDAFLGGARLGEFDTFGSTGYRPGADTVLGHWVSGSRSRAQLLAGFRLRKRHGGCHATFVPGRAANARM